MKKPIPQYQGLYWINIHGQVYSQKRKGSKGGEHAVQISKNGYWKVTLYKNGKGKNFYIHRILAELFIPNPNNYKEINHKDGNKANNDIRNLEWCTHRQNMKHAIKLGLWNNRQTTRLKPHEIEQIKKLGTTKQYKQKDIGQMFGVSGQCVCLILKGKRHAS